MASATRICNPSLLSPLVARILEDGRKNLRWSEYSRFRVLEILKFLILVLTRAEFFLSAIENENINSINLLKSRM